MPNLYRVILPVSDIDKAETFYSAILGMPGERVSPERHYFKCGGTILACYDPTKFNEKPAAVPNPEYIYLGVDDLQAYYGLCVDNDAKVTQDIQSHPWGETSFYIEDPFGNPVCFVDNKTLFTGS